MNDYWSSAVVAAIVSGAVAVAWNAIAAWAAERRSSGERRRRTYAEAYEACIAYREFAFVVRRRRADQPEAERARISDELRHIQQRLAYYTAWMTTESQEVRNTYADMVSETRSYVGELMKEAWNQPAVTNDSGMNVKGIDMSKFRAVDERYMRQVRAHLAPWPSALRHHWHRLRLGLPQPPGSDLQ